MTFFSRKPIPFLGVICLGCVCAGCVSQEVSPNVAKDGKATASKTKCKVLSPSVDVNDLFSSQVTPDHKQQLIQMLHKGQSREVKPDSIQASASSRFSDSPQSAPSPRSEGPARTAPQWSPVAPRLSPLDPAIRTVEKPLIEREGEKSAASRERERPEKLTASQERERPEKLTASQERERPEKLTASRERERPEKLTASRERERPEKEPIIRLKGLVRKNERTALAVLEVDGDSIILREGESIRLPFQGGDATLKVQKISNDSVLIQVGNHSEVIRWEAGS